MDKEVRERERERERERSKCRKRRRRKNLFTLRNQVNLVNVPTICSKLNEEKISNLRVLKIMYNNNLPSEMMMMMMIEKKNYEKIFYCSLNTFCQN